MFELTPFVFDENMIRVLPDENGNLWFVAKDVALALGYQWNGQDCIEHVPEEWRRVRSVLTHCRGKQETWILSEQGLYFFLGRSDKPRALPFQKWIAGEVLPALRKTGRYELPGAPSPEDETEPARPALCPPPVSGLREALCLRPGVRRVLWGQALQTARLENAGIPTALTWFRFLCRLSSEEGPATDVWKRVEDFMDDCLVRAKGQSVASNVVYGTFRRWWLDNGQGHIPGQKFVGSVLRSRFQVLKSSVMRYQNCALRNE